MTLETPAEVTALAARGGRIVALGSDAEIKRLIGQGTEVIDLRAAGDSRLHRRSRPFHRRRPAQMQLNLMKATSWDDIVAMVARRQSRRSRASGSTAAAGTRRSGTPSVAGRRGLPGPRLAGAVSPDNPVFLTHASGHASFANGKAMQLSDVAAPRRIQPAETS